MSKPERILKKMIERIEECSQSWVMPWHQNDFSMPISIKGHQYQGLNSIWLWMCKDIQGYSSNQWGTYQQWKAIGGNLGGQSASAFDQYILQPKLIKDDDDNKFLKGFKTWAVFNRDQVKGLSSIESDQPFKTVYSINPDKRHAVQTYISSTKAVIVHKENKAYYRPSQDLINMPDVSKFKDELFYYSTLFHELSHWTGAKNRLNRNFSRKRKDYAFEELIAEMTSAFLSSQLGIASQPTEDCITYMKLWISAMKEQPKILWDAITHAKDSMNYCNNLQQFEQLKVA